MVAIAVTSILNIAGDFGEMQLQLQSDAVSDTPKTLMWCPQS